MESARSPISKLLVKHSKPISQFVPPRMAGIPSRGHRWKVPSGIFYSANSLVYMLFAPNAVRWLNFHRQNGNCLIRV